ncbi:MAG: protein kinase [Kineosporiaceae bacterium]
MSADQIEDTGQGPGWDLPGYRLGRLLGRGGFASVYEAEQISLGRQVAVKVLMTDLGSDSDRRRFDRERTILARLSEHPSVIDVHDAGISAEGRPYIVMRLYRHGSLTNRLSADGPLPPATVATLIGHVAAALDAAHGIGVLHRDVKPSNILLTDNGQPVLADFGISLLQDAHAATGATSTTFFSLAYAAPEILEDTLFSTSSDIYGLAATAFAALAAAHPFDATDPRTASRILDGPPPELDPALPAAVRDAVRHGMARDPGDRPATATDFAIELARAAEAEPPAPPAAWDPGRPPGTHPDPRNRFRHRFRIRLPPRPHLRNRRCPESRLRGGPRFPRWPPTRAELPARTGLPAMTAGPAKTAGPERPVRSPMPPGQMRSSVRAPDSSPDRTTRQSRRGTPVPSPGVPPFRVVHRRPRPGRPSGNHPLVAIRPRRRYPGSSRPRTSVRHPIRFSRRHRGAPPLNIPLVPRGDPGDADMLSPGRSSSC